MCSLEYLAIPHETIQSGIIKVLRPHIFNKMPIRVLGFDSAGAGMQLIDRNEMFRRVLQSAFIGASQPNFQIAWTEAEELANSPPLGWQEADKRHNKLISELVEYHARYAILSHTWIRDTPGDVVFKDWEIRESNPRGYSKIAKFCEVAAKDHGVAFGWMDSICINKDSSSELDESIRSMYKWYRAAYICITYLAETRLLEDMQRDSWFTRGWTLQELLAPQCIRFYDMDWNDMLIEWEDPLDLPFFPPSRTAAEINEKIRERTTITEDELILCRCGDTEKIPISRRLELAADREVTREEDGAYSLMGLLGVDISVAYGEGFERAFFRLLRELLGAKRNVLDIFNHGYWESDNNTLIPRTLAQYKMRSSTRVPVMSDNEISLLLNDWQPMEPITLTHLGVRVPVLLVPALRTFYTQEILPDRTRLERPFPARGSFSGSIALYMSVDGTYEDISQMVYYNLLDLKLYMDTNALAETSQDGPSQTKATFGVMNFSVDGTDIILPPLCFSVLLDCGTTPPGQVRPSDSVKIMPSRTAPIFELKSRNKIPGYVDRILVNNLEMHGMQLVTLYL